MFELLNIFFVGFNFIYFYLINKNIDTYNASTFFVVATIIFISAYIGLFILLRFILKYKGKIINNLFIYFIFILTSIGFFIFIRQDFLRIIFYITNAILTFFNFLSFKYLKDKKDNYFVQEADYFTFLVSSFLFIFSVFSFNVFLSLNSMLLSLGVYLYFFISYFLLYRYCNEDKKNISKYIFVSSLICSEIFFVMTYLPYSYYVNSGLMLIFIFFVSNFGRESLSNRIDKEYFKRMLILLIFVVFIILITAKTV